VDEVIAYVAPMLLGAGASAVADLGINTIADALHLRLAEATTIGTADETNVRLTLLPPRPGRG
jgi:diaminohydroxyphosphoribosylaminopyrimidine deaminase/5-amino-6-(5-phosphoribosylamino)uracil reductase